jgi:hypothetical protein
MGMPVKYAMGPVGVTAGTHQFLFCNDGKDTMIDQIIASIASGVQTGVVRFRVGNDPTALREFSRSSLTAAAPSHSHPGGFLLYTGQYLSIDFSSVTTADTVTAYIGGH